MARPPTPSETPGRRPGIIARTLSRLGSAVSWLLLSLLLSLVIECFGVVFWWPEAGLAHSRRMLEAEIQYLDADFRDSLITDDPVRFARRLGERGYYLLFELTRLEQAGDWLRESARGTGKSTANGFRRFYEPLADFIVVAGQVVQLFMVRLAILCLATPAFLLFSLVGLVDGLVQRDLRRWGGGRESSYLYHYAKRSIWGFLVAAWVIYLAFPITVNPSLIILPFAALFAFSIKITASTFKKYL